jgi:hypothetical protein
MYKDLLLQDPTTFTQIGNFGLKIYHLATLIGNNNKFDGNGREHFERKSFWIRCDLFKVPF